MDMNCGCGREEREWKRDEGEMKKEGVYLRGWGKLWYVRIWSGMLRR
jgi:hypothetical protein